MPAEHRLDRPDAFWDIVMGSGLRRTVDGLSAPQHARLRAQVLETLRATPVRTLRNDVVFGTAVRA